MPLVLDMIVLLDWAFPVPQSVYRNAHNLEDAIVIMLKFPQNRPVFIPDLFWFQGLSAPGIRAYATKSGSFPGNPAEAIFLNDRSGLPRLDDLSPSQRESFILTSHAALRSLAARQAGAGAVFGPKRLAQYF